MPLIPYSELDSPQGGGGNFINAAAQAARGAVCGLYKNYKDFYHGGQLGFSTPPGRLIENFWDNICPNEPPYEPPPPPSPEFQGGQCACVAYTVYYSFTVIIDGTGYPGRDWKTLFGEIGGIRVGTSSSGFGNIEILCRGSVGAPCANLGWGETYALGSNGASLANPKITSVIRQDGAPDNCGNLPTENPTPIAPPPKVDTTIIFDLGGNQIDMPISISPKIIVGGEFGINNDFNANFNIKVDAPINFGGQQFEFSPSFNPELNITPQLNFNFGLGGVGVGIGGGISVGGGTGIDCDICTIAESIKDDTEETLDILKYKPVYESHAVSTRSSFKQDNIFNLGYLEITIQKHPYRSKTIFGDIADNVEFAGWLTFRRNGYNFPRLQITSKNTVYLAPEYADGFSFQATNGSMLSAIYYTEKKDS